MRTGQREDAEGMEVARVWGPPSTKQVWLVVVVPRPILQQICLELLWSVC